MAEEKPPFRKWAWVRVIKSNELGQITGAGAQDKTWRVRFADDRKSTQEERELREDELKPAY